MIERRHFFRRLVAEGFSFTEAVAGTPQFRLSDLAELPDELLFDLRPALAANVTRVETGERVCVRRGDAGALVDVCAATDPGALLLERFDGAATLDAIANDVAETLAIDASTVRRTSRDMFVRLSRLGLAVPMNALSDARDPR